MISILTRTRELKNSAYSTRIFPLVVLVVLIGIYIVLNCSLLFLNAQAQAQEDESSTRLHLQRSTSSDKIAAVEAKEIAKEIEKETIEGIEKREEDDNPACTCLEMGMELFFEQKYEEAINQLEQCIQQDPDNPEIYYYIGQSLFQQGQQAAQKNNIFKATKYFSEAYPVSDIAIEKYLKRIKGSPGEDHVNDYLQLAYIYQIRSLIPGVDEYQKAIAIYEQLLSDKPYLSHINYQMGWIYFQKKDYQNAINSFLIYLEPGRKSDFVYYHLGLSYVKIGDKENAEHYFQLLMAEFPDSDLISSAQKELKKY